MNEPFSIEVSGRRMQLKGDLDIASADVFDRAVEPLALEGGEVVIDASDLSFIDSSGIRSVLGLARRLSGKGTLVVENAGEQVQRVLHIVSADSVLEIRPRSE